MAALTEEEVLQHYDYSAIVEYKGADLPGLDGPELFIEDIGVYDAK